VIIEKIILTESLLNTLMNELLLEQRNVVEVEVALVYLYGLVEEKMVLMEMVYNIFTRDLMNSLIHLLE
jgi:hypothetical protein